MIKHINLDHAGGMYLYRLHQDKIKEFCTNDPELVKLHQFMHKAFDGRPDEYFEKGPRGSSLKFSTEHEVIQLRNHPVCDLAKNGLEENKERFKSNHSKVQLFMLENDKQTVAIEVPIWIHAHELEGYQSIFNSDEPLTGHIDVLSVEDGLVWVWDYKPNAHKEKYASTQVYFYALMLSQRTGIPLERFRCGYFDWDYAYLFKPDPIAEKQLVTPSLKSFSA